MIVNPLTNFHQGSELKRIPISQVHEDNLKLFKKISKIMRLNIIGIDFMSQDIRKSFEIILPKLMKLMVLPLFNFYYFADNKLKTHIHNKILKMYFNIN